MPVRIFGLAVLLVLSVLGAESADGANWPRFQGPNGNGVATDKGIPVQWTDKDYAWKVALPGQGNSSPIIWEHRLFLQSANDNGSERMLLCLDVADGKLLWKTQLKGAKAPTNKKNSLASSTPATDGERVYAMFWDGAQVTLYAFDFSGKQLWEHPLGSYQSQHGAGNSPMVHGGKVYLLNDDDHKASVIALDGKSGKPVWEAKRGHYRACYSTPFILERPGEPTVLIVGTTKAITAYDPDTGAKVWEYERAFDGMPLRTVAAPALVNGLIIASSGDGKGDRHAVAIRPGSKANGTGPSLAWELKKTMPYVPCFLGQGEYLYWVNDQAMAGCSEAATGKIVWSERLTKGVTASPVLIDGKIYVLNEAGEAFVYAADPTKYKLLGRSNLGESVLASPAIANGRLFLRGEKHLFCLTARSK